MKLAKLCGNSSTYFVKRGRTRDYHGSHPDKAASSVRFDITYKLMTVQWQFSDNTWGPLLVDTYVFELFARETNLEKKGSVYLVLYYKMHCYTLEYCY